MAEVLSSPTGLKLPHVERRVEEVLSFVLGYAAGGQTQYLTDVTSWPADHARYLAEWVLAGTRGQSLALATVHVGDNLRDAFINALGEVLFGQEEGVLILSAPTSGTLLFVFTEVQQ